MPFLKHTIRIPHQIDVEYDKELYKVVTKDRWNPYTDRPILNAAELFYSQRRVTNSHPSRLEKIKELLEERRKLIVFYNFNYELEILRTLNNTWSDLYEVAEYNGQVKQPVPDGDDWVYLVQYQSASEAWNCTKTDSMAFYSLTYSYRMYQQAHGRIDRMNTLYKFLSYFSLVSESSIDQGILKALKSKKNFNENRFAATENLKF
jgi:hypothetical protein